jgi:hypothetical protein
MACGRPRIHFPAKASGGGIVARVSGTLYALATETSMRTLPPAPAAGYQQLVAYYLEHRAALLLTQLVGAFGSVFFLAFVAAVAVWIARVRRGAAVLPIGVAVAGVTVATMSLTINAVAISIGMNAGRIQYWVLYKLLHDFMSATEVLMSMPLSLMVALTSWALLARQGATRWLGLAGLLVAGLLLGRTLVLIGGPALPFPPLYPVWFEVVAVTVAIDALRSKEQPVGRRPISPSRLARRQLTSNQRRNTQPSYEAKGIDPDAS